MTILGRSVQTSPWGSGLDATLDDMRYRGDDASRRRADSRRQLPWPTDREPDGDYAPDDRYPDDRYGVYEQGPRRDGYGSYGGQQGYGGYPPGGYEGQETGGYEGQGTGGYDQPAGGFPDNDWYGDSRKRAGGFADTAMHVRPDIPEGYRPGDYDVRAATRQQRVLDDSQYGAAYPGYENVDDQPGRAGYGPGGYPAQQAYDDYDDYADFTPDYHVAAPTTANPVYSEPAPTTGNPAYTQEPGYDEPGEFDAGPGHDATAGIGGYGDSFDGQGSRSGRQTGKERGARQRAPGRTGKAGRPGKAGQAGKPRRRRKIAVLGGSALCLVVAVAAVYHFLFHPSSEEASANAPLPSPGSTSSVTAACIKKFGQYCHIEFRSDDPKALTTSELYPPAFVNEKDHTSFQRIGTRTDKNCSDSVIGDALTSALDKGDCSQALRASYVSGKGSHEIMGTIGVVNLKTTNQAHYAGKVVGSSNFLAPLATSTGVGANLGKSTGVMQASFKGHYLILTWAELANEATPTNADNKDLMRFEDDLVAGTANIALSQRMVTGQPGTGT